MTRPSPPRPGTQTLHTPAIVLAATTSRDDRIVRLLTADGQLIPTLIPAGRRPRRHLPTTALVQPIATISADLQVDPTAPLARLLSAQLLSPRALTRADLLRTTLALTLCEITHHLLPDWGTEPAAFPLLTRALDHLDLPHTPPNPQLYLLFALRALDLTGILPPLADLAELPPNARATLTAWRTHRWLPLAPSDVPPTRRFLETTVTDFSGRPLRAARVLDELL